MSSDEDEDIPPTSECERLCNTFADITNTDVACAQFYLQDRKWNLDRSLCDFFDDRMNKGAVRVNKSKAEVVFVIDESQERIAGAASAILSETATCSDPRTKFEYEPRCIQSRNSSSHNKSLDIKSSTSQSVKSESLDVKSSTSQTVKSESSSSKELKFICWNMDGLNEKNLMLRTKAIYKRIMSEEADIVFLQEVVPESASFFLTHLKDFECLFGDDSGYFTGTFMKKSSLRLLDHHIIDFPDSRMMRNILKINVQLGSIPLCLMNSHLESTSDHSDERKCQLRMAFKEIMKIPDDKTVIFAGDMNLRDKELSEIGNLPAGLEDVWQMCGSRKEVMYTWDMTRNDNLVFPGKFKPRMRFDRVFLRGASPARIMPKFFGLIGIERLLPHRCFPSDHWGILCHFGLE